jgi:hypothetical protein
VVRIKVYRFTDKRASSSSRRKILDKHGNTLKPAIAQDYSKRMGHTCRSNQLIKSSISRQTWKWTKKLLFARA